MRLAPGVLERALLLWAILNGRLAGGWASGLQAQPSAAGAARSLARDAPSNPSRPPSHGPQATGHKIDYDDWHAHVHGALPYEKYLQVGLRQAQRWVLPGAAGRRFPAVHC